jgi:hypothetical protein
MSQDATPTPGLQDALTQVDRDLKAIMDLLVEETGEQASNAETLAELKRLAAQAHDVLQQAVQKVESF